VSSRLSARTQCTLRAAKPRDGLAGDGAPQVLRLSYRREMLLPEDTVVMSDPLLSSVATAVAAKAAELAVQSGKDACGTLVRLIRERFSHDKEATAALEAAQRNPADQAAVTGLALALQHLAAEDAAFAARIRELWPLASAELSAASGGVVNSATGSVGGHLLQARDVHVEGGMHFGDVDPGAA
jgi:hypothetical protein